MKAYTAPDYSALLQNIGKLPGNQLAKPMNPLEDKCSIIFAQRQSRGALPPSLYRLPLRVASSPAASLALTRITDLLVAFNESNRVFVLVS